jgi:hypothetical protein
VIIGAEEVVQALGRVEHILVGAGLSLIVLIIFARRIELGELGVEFVVGGCGARRRGAVGGVERHRRCADEGRAHDGDRLENVGPHQRGPRRHRRTRVVPDDGRHRAIAERIDEPDRVPHHVEGAELVGIVIEGIVPAERAPVAPLIRRDDVISGRRQERHHLAPAIDEFGKAVQQHDERPVGRLVAGLQDVHGEAVDVVDGARAHARGKRPVAVGW